MRNFGFAMVLFMLIELAGLILVGNWIGVLPTILLVVISSVVGIILVKKIGVHSAKSIELSVKRGEAPTFQIIRGFMSLVGSVLLIIPGFITSIIGLVMLIPGMQNVFKPVIFAWLRKKMKKGQITIYR